MKKAVLALLLISASLVSHAQFSVGVRTGASYWMSAIFDKHVSSSERAYSKELHGFVWDKQIYGRYETKGRWTFDISLGHFYLNENMAPAWIFDYAEGYPGTPYKIVSSPGVTIYPQHNSFLELNFSAQLELRILKTHRISQYAGLVASPILAYYSDDGKYDNTVFEVRKPTTPSVLFYIGLQHYLEYAISKRVNINSLLQAKIRPGSYLDFLGSDAYYSPKNTRFSWQLGVGYQL